MFEKNIFWEQKKVQQYKKKKIVDLNSKLLEQSTVNEQDKNQLEYLTVIYKKKN